MFVSCGPGSDSLVQLMLGIFHDTFQILSQYKQKSGISGSGLTLFTRLAQDGKCKSKGEVLWKGWHVVVSTISFPKCWKHAYQGDRSAKRTATPSQIVRNVKICNIFWHFSIKCDVFCFPLSAFSRKFLSVHSLCMCRQKETDKLTLLYIVYINIYIIKMTETTEISCVAFLARDKHEFYLL